MPNMVSVKAGDARGSVGGMVEMDLSDRVAQVQEEIQKVKDKLDNNANHFGMSGPLLQEYLIELIKKETSLYDIVAASASSSSAPFKQMSRESINMGNGNHGNGRVVDTNNLGGNKRSGSNSNPRLSSSPLGDYPRKLAKLKCVVKAADKGKHYDNAPKLQKEDLESVIKFLNYVKDVDPITIAGSNASDLNQLEGESQEQVRSLSRALKALVSLVYKVENAKKALKTQNVLEILDVVMRRWWDSGEGQVAGLIAASTCNLAYDPDSSKILVSSSSGVNLFILILDAMSMFPTQKYLHQKGAEAFARIVSDPGEAGNPVNEPADGEKIESNSHVFVEQLADPRLISVPDASLASRVYVFVRILLLAKGKMNQQSITSKEGLSRSSFQTTPDEVFAHWSLLQMLVTNEVCTAVVIAEQLVENLKDIRKGEASKRDSSPSNLDDYFGDLVVGACITISGMCVHHSASQQQPGGTTVGDFPALLRELGLIPILINLMHADSLTHSVPARSLIEAVARIIATSTDGLAVFVNLGGVQAFETLMTKFLEDKILQARSIRALASGVDWPVEIREIACFNYVKLIEKTYRAMEFHHADPWLLCAGLEGFYKFLPKVISPSSEVGGEEIEAEQRIVQLVESKTKQVMLKFPEDHKLEGWGSRILEMMMM